MVWFYLPKLFPEGINNNHNFPLALLHPRINIEKQKTLNCARHFFAIEHAEQESFCAHFFAAISASTSALTSSPASHLFSSAMKKDTPSTIVCTSCTSLLPRRMLLLMSTLPPGPGGLCSPREPRTCISIDVAKSSMACMPTCSCSFGSSTCMDARKPVPRLDTQAENIPTWSLAMNLSPLPLTTFSTALTPSTQRAKTWTTSPPFCMEITRI